MSLTDIACDNVRDEMRSRLQAELQAQAQARAREPLLDVAKVYITDQQRLREKLRLFRECQRRANAAVDDTWRRYSDDIDPASGAPRNRSNRPHLPPLDSALVPCTAAETQGPGLAPDLPTVQANLTRYAESARQVARHSAELATYLNEGGYSHDNWAKSRALAPAMRSAYDAFQLARQQLDAVLEDQMATLDTDELAELTQHNQQDVHWHSLRVLDSARATYRCLVVGQLPPDRCSGSIDAFEQARAALDRYVDSNPDELESVFWLASFRRAASDFEGALDRSARRDPGSRPNVATTYRTLAEAGEKLRFDFP